jgi:hypothetical protein
MSITIANHVWVNIPSQDHDGGQDQNIFTHDTNSIQSTYSTIETDALIKSVSLKISNVDSELLTQIGAIKDKLDQKIDTAFNELREMPRTLVNDESFRTQLVKAIIKDIIREIREPLKEEILKEIRNETK